MEQSLIKIPTRWRSGSALERGLAVLAVSLVLTVIGLAIAVGLMSSLPQNCQSDCRNVCLTTECIQTASRVLEYMDENIEPCDDFYKFSCGKFIQDTIISDSAGNVDILDIVKQKVQKQLRKNFEEKIRPGEKKHFKLVKNLYQNCMNQSAINERGIKSVQNIIKKFGGWPVVDGDAWREEGFEWKQSVYQFRKHGFSSDYFFETSVMPDINNTSKHVLVIDQTSLGVPRQFLSNGMNDVIVKTYYKYMVNIAVHFGAAKTRAKEELKQSLNFEMKLANISLSNEERQNVSALYNLMTIKELKGNYPSIPWKEYLNTLLSPIVKIEDNELVAVFVPSLLREFEKLIAQTPKRVQANYVIWRAVESTISFLSEDVRKRQPPIIAFLGDQTQIKPRWKECIRVTSQYMHLSVGALYVRNYFNEDSKKSAIEMVTDIRQEFRKILENVDWMDKKTKASALEKLMSMSTQIAYPDELLDDEKLDDFYRKLEITPGDFSESILNLTLFGKDYVIGTLRKPYNKSEWINHNTPASIKAMYDRTENYIVFPAGILQENFFSRDRPRYMNYGAIGSAIGHEITHGFDLLSQQFDQEGNLIDWWESETKEKYLSRAECIIHQYGNYTVKEVGMQLNGINTERENIADNGGIKESYLAYQEWVKRNGPELKLPGLKYTPLQLFWISAAQMWCNKYKPGALKFTISIGNHSPGEFRVLGSFSNRPEFAKDFKCPRGSKMNPEKKCSVW